MHDFRITRFVERELPIDDYDDLLTRKKQDLLECCRSLKVRSRIIQTCGGCLRLLTDLSHFTHGSPTTRQDFAEIANMAQEAVYECMLNDDLQAALEEACDYFTLGVDIYHDGDYGSTHAELVGVYDSKDSNFRLWTGKSYPLQGQANSLMYCNDLDTHFIELDGDSVMILGCHDLNIFSPRSRASAAPGSYKEQVMKKMDRLVQINKPEIVLHHPHYTDSPRIWSVPWTGVERSLPFCHTYSSGICFANRDGEKPRGRLQDVLSKTARGNVQNWIQKDGLN